MGKNYWQGALVLVCRRAFFKFNLLVVVRAARESTKNRLARLVRAGDGPWPGDVTMQQDSHPDELTQDIDSEQHLRAGLSESTRIVHPAGQWPASISSSSRCAVVGPIGHNR